MGENILKSKNYMWLFSEIDIMEISIYFIVELYKVLGECRISFEKFAVYKRYYYLINLNFNLKFLN